MGREPLVNPLRERAVRVHAQTLMSNPERTAMFCALEQRLGAAVLGYVWGSRGLHPIVVLLLSFVISQSLNELIVYELFEAYGTRSLARTAFEVVAPLTMWWVVDSALYVMLNFGGWGQRVLVQTADDQVHVFYRQFFRPVIGQFDYSFVGTLGIEQGTVGVFVDRLQTPRGCVYVWARWRDVRLLLTPSLLGILNAP
jgi:hypothetical protein